MPFQGTKLKNGSHLKPLPWWEGETSSPHPTLLCAYGILILVSSALGPSVEDVLV